jgi:hypothetical protein
MPLLDTPWMPYTPGGKLRCKQGGIMAAQFRYMVKAFVPAVEGCGATDTGWDDARCTQYQEFLNTHAAAGWRLHSCEYRAVTVKGGCNSSKGVWLICTFEMAA